MDIKERIIKLRQEIDKHRIAYYTHDAPTLPDEAYDALFRELITLENQHREYDDPNSPTHALEPTVIDKFNKVQHDIRQWSFDNVFDFEELKSWDERNAKIIEKENLPYKPKYMCELKIDGLKVVLSYKNGMLARAATRGDGLIGEDVTHNIRTIRTIPHYLPVNIDLTVVGECWIKQDDLEKINQEQIKRGEPIYANTRNLAAGTLRQLDNSYASKRNLQYFAYDIELQVSDSDLNNKINTQEEELKHLKMFGFNVNNMSRLCMSLDEVNKYYESLIEKRHGFDYGVDGLVIKINDRNIWDALGYTARSPRGGIAFKFPAEIVTTKLNDVIFQVGRTGVITPVASLDPVQLAGSTVKRATLHNEDEIKRLDIMIGDTVLLRKAGDVIPEVFDRVIALRGNDAKEIVFPILCPVCKSKLIRKQVGKELGVHMYCDNVNCEAKHAENLIHFVSKKAANIEGLGEKTIIEFKELGLITDYASIYELKVDDIKDLFGYGVVSANNIINSINNSKIIKLNNFIYALGIVNIGEVAAKDLAKHFKNLSTVMKANIDDIIEIENFGLASATSLYEYFHNKDNIERINRLLKYVTISDYEEEKVSSKFTNMTFVITGSLNKSREYYKGVIEANGGKVSGSVSSKTSYLLMGEDAGSKYDDAIKYNIKIISEKEFMNML